VVLKVGNRVVRTPRTSRPAWPKPGAAANVLLLVASQGGTLCRHRYHKA
jgi:hypothetical protein